MEIAALTTLLAYRRKMEMIKRFMTKRIIFDSLITQNNNSNPGNKHLWIKKATGLGISEFMLIYGMALFKR
jgi:hypothetical protein